MTHHILTLSTDGPSNRIPFRKKQGVVLLAGPHKTASSSMQRNFYHWLDAKSEEDISGLSKQWAWPSPMQTFVDHGCEMNDSLASKIFYMLIESIKGRRNKSRCITSFYSTTEIIKLYHDEICKRWNQGYNLVIGSEAMDFIASEHDGPKILDDLIHALPWHAKENPLHGSDEDITAVVAYRAPRVDHLISLWHQCCMERMSFYEYLTRLRSTYKEVPLRSLDSLKLASAFVEKDIDTVLIDMSGVKALGYDMTNVVACDILHAECTEHRTFPGAPKKKAAIVNVKTHSDTNFNITDAQLRRINDVIETYDCNFATLMEHEKLKVVYSNALDASLSKCQERESKVYSRDDMVQQIIDIARDSTSVGG
jgi:hypothetical protein